MSQKYPEVQGGGSLIVAWQIKNKNVLVVGGGEVAAGRILHALNADAKVTIVCPTPGLNDEVAHRISTHHPQVTHIPRDFDARDLDGADMVLCAVDDPAASTRVWQLCKERRIPANIADVPSQCDFYFGSVYRDGPLQVMVSTNGNGPKLASMVRKKIAETLPEKTGVAIQNVGGLRRRLREVAPDLEQGSKRMKWYVIAEEMSRICEKWSLEELVQMDDQDIDFLLSRYESGKVPSFAEVRENSGRS